MREARWGWRKDQGGIEEIKGRGKERRRKVAKATVMAWARKGVTGTRWREKEAMERRRNGGKVNVF